jgi:hypothetical protein
MSEPYCVVCLHTPHPGEICHAIMNSHLDTCECNGKHRPLPSKDEYGRWVP